MILLNLTHSILAIESESIGWLGSFHGCDWYLVWPLMLWTSNVSGNRWLLGHVCVVLRKQVPLAISFVLHEKIRRTPPLWKSFSAWLQKISLENLRVVNKCFQFLQFFYGRVATQKGGICLDEFFHGIECGANFEHLKLFVWLLEYQNSSSFKIL